MASLPLEEENYVRMSLLLTGISPRAVRTCFDNEFAPACLDASLKKEYNKLLDLKKQHIINQPQWNLLFPRFPGQFNYVSTGQRICIHRQFLINVQDKNIEGQPSYVFSKWQLGYQTPTVINSAKC
ncbi:Hypothetical predicted protein [Mytilus galloprovincialis]|uniref:Uncharacterized protein n=1 Tax=Mytilus galloprovincialis TaxID=29158 RepID=A0A8B6ED33_MYTGA|nr:Hypothetical predicted protein [Mytilus galloprovincialis]